MVRVRRWVAAAAFAAGAFGLSACNNSSSGSGSHGSTASAATPQQIGVSLYPPQPMPALPAFQPAVEPIVIPNAVVQNDLRVQVPAQVDGLIELIATPLAAGEECPPELVVYHPRDFEKDPQKRTRYRRLRENDIVRKEQILARQDEQLVDLQIRSNQNLEVAMKDAIASAKEAEDAQDTLAKLYDKLKGAMSESDRLSNVALVARYRENRLQSVKELAKIQGDLMSAQATLARYWVKSPINGRVVKLLKSPQEFAKAGDVVMEIQATDRIRVEGKLDVQYADLVRRGMKVTVEPARPVGPDYDYHNPGHHAEVTSVAVTAHPGRPLVVSGGLDNTALVWDPFVSKNTHRLPHPTGVRSVAAVGEKSKTQWVATGGEDGKVRLWDLTNPDKLPKEPAVTLDESLGSAVLACAFSPDGKFLAAAGGRDVFVWSVNGKESKRLYALPAEHRDAVTFVRFTPQATLVTASRDKSIRVWKLGDQGAAAQTTMDHRGGSVDVLGVSSDGSRVLFDKDPTRLDVVSLADERSVGTLQSPGGGARFATLAIFSADDALVLTAGGEADQRGELTLWDAPQPGGRGAEKIRALTPRGAAVTCAAFSPDKEKRFVVVGTAEGGVHLWTAAAATARREKPLTGEVVSVLPADARSMTVRVELENPTEAGEGLKDRSLATILIDPTQPPPAPAAPAAPGRPISTTPADAGAVIPAGGVAPAVSGPPAPIPPVAAPPEAGPPAAAPTGTFGPRVPTPPTAPPVGKTK
jgi:WD40 repeat protein